MCLLREVNALHLGTLNLGDLFAWCYGGSAKEMEAQGWKGF